MTRTVFTVAALGAAAAVFLNLPLAFESRAGGGGRQSTIVLRFDGTGTTIYRIFPDLSEWTIENNWYDNSANGTVRNPDGTLTVINCLPSTRSNQQVDLICRIFDQGAGSYGEPILTMVTREFLEGDFTNPYNSLFGLTGTYSLLVEDGMVSRSYRIRFLDAGISSSGIPFLIGTTNPPTFAAFVVRSTDLQQAGSTTGRLGDVVQGVIVPPGQWNFVLGVQTDETAQADERCIDVYFTPTGNQGASSPSTRGVLAGELGSRRRNANGSCGETIAEGLPVALVPNVASAPGPTRCRYTVTSVGSCSGPRPLQVNDTICLSCDGGCRMFTQPIHVITDQYPSYGNCTGVAVSLAPGGTCSTGCNGTAAVPVVED